MCSVRYKDLDYAVKVSLRLQRLNKVHQLFYAKTDLTSAFRILPVRKDQLCWLLLKATHPINGITYFFADKNLPFGASSSCRLFQNFSDSLKHLIEAFTNSKWQTTNYLDDFLFTEISEQRCNRLVNRFIELCHEINCPLSAEKTEWASKKLIFLGILLDGENSVLAIPTAKRDQALSLIRNTIAKRKIKIKNIQKLTGTLNFLNRAMITGRAFMRRMYSKLTDLKNGMKVVLKDYHHVTLDAEFLYDCKMWELFLSRSDQVVLCRPFMDILGSQSAKTLLFYTDASGSISKGGFGAFFSGNWFFGLWGTEFMQKCQPSIEFLELYALCLGIFTWADQLANMRIKIFL